jgi:SPP1 gp7 family putative phage head morphogenesis protein
MGVAVPLRGDLGDRVAAATADNVALISSIPPRFFDDVQTTITRAARTGQRWEDLAHDLDGRYDLTEDRARLIARDQIGKFYGEVQQERQQALGVDGYIWRTVNDQRVRDNHSALDGERCSWDDPPDGGGTDEDEAGHPGSGINCRCYAEPDFSNLLGDDE